MSNLIEKHNLINDAEAAWVAARVAEGVPEAEAVARLKAARVGPAAEREGTLPARHVPGGEAPSRPTGGLTEPAPPEVVEPEPDVPFSEPDDFGDVTLDEPDKKGKRKWLTGREHLMS